VAESAVTIAVVYPDLLGTYGDGGNAIVLAQRLRWRGVAAAVVPIALGTPLPSSADVYVLGGGEDAPQSLAADELRRSRALGTAVDGGAVVLAVCAGLQVVGTRFLTAEGVREGAGLVDVSTERGLARRAVGELVVDPAEGGLPVLTGYENHAGASRLGAGVAPLGRVRVGVGNGEGGVDGFVAGRILGTYLHGPVLARNPAVADLLLGWVVGELPGGDERLAAADAAAAVLRDERLTAAAAGKPRRTNVRTGERTRRRPWLRTPRRSWTRPRCL
jgi:lipid II isoglutaminyl synthase (glutamine-hydrolysing)